MRSYHVSILLGLLLVPALLLAGTTGKIKGKVFDQGNNEPLVGANVAIIGTNYGAATDVNGEYTILNIPAGTYTVKATFVGYTATNVSNVRVSSDLTTDLNIALSSESVTMEQVEIIAQRPLINKDYTNTLTIKSAEDISNLPIRGVTNVIGLQASVVQNEGSNLLYIRGGRPNEVSYVIDGVSSNNPLSGNAANSFLNINQNSVEELQIQTGGFNAEFGSAMSGVVSLNTKQASTKYFFTAEGVTDAFQSSDIGEDGGYGFNVFNLSAGGPIIPDNDVASLYISAERQDLKDNDPRARGGVKPNTETESWNLGGKLTLRPMEAMDVKLGGSYFMTEGQNWDNFRRFRAPEHHQRFDNSTLSLYARLTHNVGKNVFYTVQGSMFDEKILQGDGVWFEDLLSYGDPVKNPTFPSVSQNPAALFSVVAAPGSVLDEFEKQQSVVYSFTGDVSVQEGHHLVKLGGEYRTHNIRRYRIDPLGLAQPNTGASAGWTGYRNNNVEYYGYSFDGNSEYDGEDDFFNSQLEGPKDPLYLAAYLQDKIELSDLVLNLGLRLDHFDANEQVAIDKFNPFGARGSAGGGVFEERDLRESNPTTTVSPRFGFSFPVTDKAVFHAQYGTFLQMPPLQYVLISKTWFDRYASGAAGFSTRIPNPDLKPERTVSYEIGFKTVLGDNASFSVTGFYKEIKDLIQSRNVGSGDTPAYPSGYETFENVDFGTVKGFDIIFELRRSKNLAVTFNYTLGFANGTGSDPNTQSRITWIQTESPKVVAPLDFDRRHIGSVNVNYRTGAGEGPKLGDVSIFERMGMSLLFTFNSGVPYTRTVIFNPFFGGVTEVPPTGAVNGAYTPWNFRFDLSIDRSFELGPLNLVATFAVLNLLDADNIGSVARQGIDPAGTSTGVFRGTGEADNSGWLSTPDGQDYARLNGPEAVALFQARENNPNNYGIPRMMRLGLRLEY